MTQNKKFFITINGQIDDVNALFDEQSMQYMAVCMEAAPTTGHLHYHVFVCYHQRRRLTAVVKDFPHSNVQVAKGTFNQVLDYLTKDGNLIFEKGEKPEDRRRSAPTPTESRFLEMVNDAKKGNLNKECLLYARYRTYFDQLEMQNMLRFAWMGELSSKNIWIYGPPGSGKSRMVQEYIESSKSTVYLKTLNKWWDGFYKQQVVLVEDADPQYCQKLAHHFKIWADRYSFAAEVKNGYIVVYPDYHFVITSNYSIDECFDAVDAAAIRRRFDIFYLE